MNRKHSDTLFAEALEYMPGGVNSPVRAFRAVGGQPFFVNKARGSRVWDVDGNEYVDYVLTWGPAILGHAHPKIIAAVKTAADNGTSFGIPNPDEIKLAKLIHERMPAVRKVRMTNSGTEACMSAIRLARGFTGRDKIIKFEGCYHGHADSLLVKAGSGALTFGNPDSAGVPAAFTQHTVVLPFNDPDAVKAAFAANQNQIAGIIVEPVPGNAGVYLPRPGYLEFLRDITRSNGALLIFDEVMTGFRVARGGAQERFGIEPDLTCLGKVIGGGLPVGAFGGRAEIMDYLAPLGPVYQAGTLSGNPVAMAAGIATLEQLTSPHSLDPVGTRYRASGRPPGRPHQTPEESSAPARSRACKSAEPSPPHDRSRACESAEPSPPHDRSRACESAASPSPQELTGNAYSQLEHLGAQLEAGMRHAAKSAGIPVQFNRCGSMFCAYFTAEPVWNLADAMKSDRERFKKYFHGMLEAGVYLAPSQFEAGFLSTAHSEADIEKTVAAATRILRKL